MKNGRWHYKRPTCDKMIVNRLLRIVSVTGSELSQPLPNRDIRDSSLHPNANKSVYVCLEK
jgi:hypothetical protein